jgi:hypothetical protein
MKKHRVLFFLAKIFLSNGQAQQIIRLNPGKAPGLEKWNWPEKEISRCHAFYNVVDSAFTVYLPDATLSKKFPKYYPQ